MRLMLCGNVNCNNTATLLHRNNSLTGTNDEASNPLFSSMEHLMKVDDNDTVLKGEL